MSYTVHTGTAGFVTVDEAVQFLIAAEQPST